MENILNTELYAKLDKAGIFEKEKLDSFIHSLVDIKASIDEIYNVYIPILLKNESGDSLEETIWDIREEFRHISYHIEDANLTDISIDR